MNKVNKNQKNIVKNENSTSVNKKAKDKYKNIIETVFEYYNKKSKCIYSLYVEISAFSQQLFT